MISEIHMNKVASFDQNTSICTDKKINLIYGLNGVGKSTLSNYLYAPDDARYSGCRIVSDSMDPVIVYNQRFIQENFFVSDNLKGIFSLSKENKEVETKISEWSKQRESLVLKIEECRTKRGSIVSKFEEQKKLAMEEVWKIKAQYSGGDRVLEYCLDGLKGKKETLFEHLCAVEKPESEPERTVAELRQDVDNLNGENAVAHETVEEFVFAAADVEDDVVWSEAVLGNSDSEVAGLIEAVGNSDWVRQGLAYLPTDVEGSIECPFCQQSTISSKLVFNLRSYFDRTYQDRITKIEMLQKKYLDAVEQVRGLGYYLNHPSVQNDVKLLEARYLTLQNELRENISKIAIKVESPKLSLSLSSSAGLISDFNSEIGSINLAIAKHNERLANRSAALQEAKKEFWLLMRWSYDQTISRFESDRKAANQDLEVMDRELRDLEVNSKRLKEAISQAQKETVNTDAAVEAINTGLLDIGIDGFKIQKQSDRLYRVVRSGDSDHAFQSLSEGEKMMISFLYFCELCKGRLNPDDVHAKRIVVIDDPISSLSHIFVFNIGQLIRSVFFKNDSVGQVFVLTHSLYFFYELTDPNHERRKDTQKLFRIHKSSLGSVFDEMKYEEIQNDYQAYWSVINDSSQPAALIANCMRNIVEYFFNFVRRKDLNNVFLMPELQSVKFQAFCRYVNRESHSLGQNIIDMKEFDYEVFKEGLRLVFDKTGYSDHFKAMSKI